MILRWFFNRKPKAKPISLGGYVARGLFLLTVWLFVYYLWIGLHIAWWSKFNPSSTSFMDARLFQLQQENPKAKLKQQWVAYNQISNNLKRAVIASEDAKFLQHNGFDWEGIKHAMEKNIKKRRLAAGGSTITQQLAKNLFLSSDKTLWRKLDEVVITVMLEHMLSKQRIYEIYLNVIEWGNDVFGVQAAAQHYYRRSAHSMTTTQAARLAVMIPRPRYYDQHRHTRYLNRRTATISARLKLVKVP